MSIRNKLILVLLIFSIIPVTVLVMFETKRDQETLERQIGVSSLEFARLAMRRINEYLYFRLENAQSWGNNINQDDLSNDSQDGNISNYLKKILDGSSEYYYIICLDREGRVVASSNSEFVGIGIEADMEIQNALQGNIIIQDVSYSTMAGGNAIVISVPIADKSTRTKTIGVVSVALKWSKVNEMIASLEIGGKKQNISDHVMLTNKDGLVISCFDKKKMFSDNLISMGLQSAKFAQKHKEGSIVETSEHGLSSFSTYTYMKEYKNMPLLNWLLMIYQDSERIFVPVYSLKTTMLYILPVTIVFLVITSFYIANRISNPILSLASIAHNIGKGDLTKEVNIRCKDEIGILADSFNKMRVELIKSFENVERHSNELQLLSKRIVVVQEKERKNLSRELHDEAGQTLVALKINLEMVSKLMSKDTVQAHKYLDESEKILNNTIRVLRNMSFFLRPTILDDLGLVDAIESYASVFTARTNIAVDVRSNLEARRFKQDVELSFYRMVQEALTNVVKHSEAKNVHVQIYEEGSELILSVQDNGNGFDVKKESEKQTDTHAVGLLGMRERFASIGADLSILSAPGEGTTLIARYQSNIEVNKVVE